MKKNYIITLVVVVAVLIVSVITFGVLSGKQMKNLEKAEFYKIGEAQLKTINSATNTNLNLKNYSYGSSNGEHKKFFEYAVSSALNVYNEYSEYLLEEENFIMETEESKMRLFSKEYENKDILKVVISYGDDTVDVNLIYLYID